MRKHNSKELLLQMIEWTENFAMEQSIIHGMAVAFFICGPVQKYNRHVPIECLIRIGKPVFCLSKEIAGKIHYSRAKKLESFVLEWIDKSNSDQKIMTLVQMQFKN